MTLNLGGLGEDLQRLVVEQSMRCKGEYTIPSILYSHMKLRPTSKTLEMIVNSVKTEFDGGYSIRRPASRDNVLVTCEQHQNNLDFDAACLQFKITRNPQAPLREIFKMEAYNREGTPVLGFSCSDRESSRHIDASHLLGGSDNRIQKFADLVGSGRRSQTLEVYTSGHYEQRTVLGTFHDSQRRHDVDIEFLHLYGKKKCVVSKDIQMSWWNGTPTSDRMCILYHPDDDKDHVPHFIRKFGYYADVQHINALPGGLHENCVLVDQVQNPDSVCGMYQALYNKTKFAYGIGRDRVLELYHLHLHETSGKAGTLVLSAPSLALASAPKRVRIAGLVAAREAKKMIEELGNTCTSGRSKQANPDPQLGQIDDRFRQEDSLDPEDLSDAESLHEDDEEYNQKTTSAIRAYLPTPGASSSEQDEMEEEDEEEDHIFLAPAPAPAPSRARVLSRADPDYDSPGYDSDE